MATEKNRMSRITVVLTDGYSDWEIAPLCGIGRAFYGADIRYTSPKGGPLTSAAGLPITSTDVFAPPDGGVVVVCGSPAFEQDPPPDISDRLETSHEAGCTIAGICGGTIALAQAGLLNSVPHTSNERGYLERYVPDYLGSRHYLDQAQAVRADAIITAPAHAPASFAAEVLKAADLDPVKADQLGDMLTLEHKE